MLDLHCHMLPGIDDGAPDLDTALAMARMAVADGITLTACTPHIYPGMYENTAAGIKQAIADFAVELARHDIPLQLVAGADTHMQGDLVAGIRSGRIPTLADSRYMLFEPPHHVAPPRLEESVFELQAAGYVPIITHPERLTWIENHYEIFVRMARAGVLMQLTAGSLTGRFGARPRYWGERMLDAGLVHLLATDAHSLRRRPPLLAEGRAAAAQRVGEAEAERLVHTRPAAIVADVPPAELPPVDIARRRTSIWRGLFKRHGNPP